MSEDSMKGSQTDSLSVSFNRFMEKEETTEPEAIFKAIFDSKTSGTVIGIRSAIFGNIMVLTGIQEVILEDVPVIILKHYDVNGYMLPVTRIRISDIKSVHPFTSKFENPFIPKNENGVQEMLA